MKFPIILLLLSGALLGHAQDSHKPDDKTKKIEVRGLAERSVIPDEIHLRITLKEYKQGNQKVEMDGLEQNLVSALKKLKIDEANLRVDNIYGYNWNWKKRKAEEYLATKSFRLKLNDVKMVNDLIDLLDPEGLNSMNVAKITHSEIKDIKHELKAEALRAAKDKADYLLKSIGETLGPALEIQEINYGYQPPVYARGRTFDTLAAESSGYQSDVEFRSIDIKAEFRVVFEIK